MNQPDSSSHTQSSTARPGGLRNNATFTATALTLVLLLNSMAHAQWENQGIVLCDTLASAGIWAVPRSAPDGEGGSYVCWQDVRGGDYDIYAQHVDSSGRVLWQRNGLPVAAIAATEQSYPRMTSDEQGGAFIAWEDSRSLVQTYPYVQHIAPDGTALWQANGVQASTTGGLFISLSSDKRHGVLLAWSTVEGVVAQRLDSTGARLWGDGGVQLTTRPGTIASGDVAVSPDGFGGAIILWSEGFYPNYHVYIQRVDSSGVVLWETNGKPLSDTALAAGGLSMSTDLAGNVIADWNYGDGVSAATQKLDLQGHPLWPGWGIPLIVQGPGASRRNSSDGRGGAFIGKGWRVNHLSSLGEKIWGDSGAAFIGNSSSVQGLTNATHVPDGQQGVFNFCEYIPDYSTRFIQVQWIDGDGKSHFGANGQPVTHLPQASQFTPTGVTDGRGGAIVAWNDFRHGTSAIYAARVNKSGTVTGARASESPSLPASTQLEQNYPNPFNPSTTIRYALPHRSNVTLDVFNTLGQRVATLVSGEVDAGYHEVQFNAAGLASAVYFYSLHVGEFTQTRKLCVIR